MFNKKRPHLNCGAIGQFISICVENVVSGLGTPKEKMATKIHTTPKTNKKARAFKQVLKLITCALAVTC